jgi:hypothetical protein
MDHGGAQDQDFGNRFISGMSGVGWNQSFDGPIPVPGRKPLVTLRDAGHSALTASKLKPATYINFWIVSNIEQRAVAVPRDDNFHHRTAFGIDR